MPQNERQNASCSRNWGHTQEIGKEVRLAGRNHAVESERNLCKVFVKFTALITILFRRPYMPITRRLLSAFLSILSKSSRNLSISCFTRRDSASRLRSMPPTCTPVVLPNFAGKEQSAATLQVRRKTVRKYSEPYHPLGGYRCSIVHDDGRNRTGRAKVVHQRCP